MSNKQDEIIRHSYRTKGDIKALYNSMIEPVINSLKGYFEDFELAEESEAFCLDKPGDCITFVNELMVDAEDLTADNLHNGLKEVIRLLKLDLNHHNLASYRFAIDIEPKSYISDSLQVGCEFRITGFKMGMDSN